MSNIPLRGEATSPATSSYVQSEFFAEDTLISILPSFKHAQIHLVHGDFGPFTPSIPVQVPLWLALTLKKLHRCTIECPHWFEVDKLEETLRLERTSAVNDDLFDNEASASELQKLPAYFFQICTLLLEHAPDDIQHSDSLRRLIEDIQSVRAAKLRSRLQQDLRVPFDAYSLGKLSALEIDANRPAVSKIMTDLYRYGVPAQSSTSTRNASESTPQDRNSSSISTPQSASATRPRQLRRIQRNT